MKKIQKGNANRNKINIFINWLILQKLKKKFKNIYIYFKKLNISLKNKSISKLLHINNVF